MLKLAILKQVKSSNGQTLYQPIMEGEDGEFERELREKIEKFLGPKELFSAVDVDCAVKAAFEEYKKEFKEKTVTLP